jgi:hypothetical protein
MADTRQQMLSAISDQRRFFLDIMPQIQHLRRDVEQKAGTYGVSLASLTPQTGSELGNVTVSGSTASGMVNVRLGEHSLPLVQHFALVDGSWRVDLTRQFHAE